MNYGVVFMHYCYKSILQLVGKITFDTQSNIYFQKTGKRIVSPLILFSWLKLDESITKII